MGDGEELGGLGKRGGARGRGARIVGKNKMLEDQSELCSKVSYCEVKSQTHAQKSRTSYFP